MNKSTRDGAMLMSGFTTGIGIGLLALLYPLLSNTTGSTDSTIFVVLVFSPLMIVIGLIWWRRAKKILPTTVN